jgi:predicted metalloprotease with PDZ domain
MDQRLIPLAFLAPFAVLAAANSAPTAAPLVDPIPAARDVAWPGTLRLAVDATDVTHGIFLVKETIPVSAPGPLTLLYPKWLPGEHSPNGPILELAGLKITSGGQTLPWLRDPVDVYAFHVTVPAGAAALQLDFQFLSPTDASQGPIVATPVMLALEWNTVALYPAGTYVRQIPVEASLTLPDGWKLATALPRSDQTGATFHFQSVALDTLIDSPVFAGVNLRTETLAPGVRLNLVADRPEQLAATAEELQLHRNLVAQAIKLFGAQHYDHYDILLALSDRQSGMGLEHHRSSEDGVTGKYFTDWKGNIVYHDLVAHEYTHSWNGKFRRPFDLWTPDYRQPMQDSLLWVYEGQTQFWGFVLAARAGLLTREDVLGAFANFAAAYDARIGRTWRPLIDTTNDPVIAERRPQPWVSWQRSEDYYNEGLLLWLDADSLIRQLSHGARSLDDFARAFFGVRDRDWGELTYNREDVARTLNAVQPHDWAKFLQDHLDNTSQHAPLDGFTRGSYRLVYTDTPTDWIKGYEKARKITDLSYSGGLIIAADGTIAGVMWDSPAFDAGLTVGTKLVAVEGRAYDAEDLKAAIKAKFSPLSLLVRTGDAFRTVSFSYTGGLRYPSLVKSGTGASSLEALLAPRP